jgi:hypothetical protein
MNKVFTPILASHSRTLPAVNSGPLSERMYLGTPRRTQVAQSLQYLLAGEPPRYIDCQALTCVFIDQGQHTESTAVARAIGDEVVAPNMILVRRAKSHTRTIIQP